jgi:hypothetical protein
VNAVGALFTVATCWSLGRLLFIALGVRLKRLEHDLLASTVGSALLSALVFGLSTVGLARTPVFILAGGIAIGLAIWRLRNEPGPMESFHASVPVSWKLLFAVCFTFYALLYLSNSLAPEHSPDGSTYHLALVARYFREHALVRIPTNFYASLPQGIEMLYLFAFAFGQHSAAATVHCCFLMALPCLMMSYGLRIDRPRAGITAGLLFYLSPLAGIDGVSAYNDVALATIAFSLFYLLEIWREGNREGNNESLSIPIGLLAGFCFAIKYTGFVAPLYMATVLFAGRKRSAILSATTAACLIAVPWLLKNWIVAGNPVSPFLNSFFPNPHVHVSFETFYRNYFKSYGLASFAPLFRMVTVTGELGGQIGPVFLLAPLALLALRSRAGRHCLLAALFFLLPYPQNIGARFLLPALPFIAMGIGLALEFSQVIQTVLVSCAIVLAWPAVINRYRSPAGGWQIAAMPWQAALGIHDREEWLSSRFADYNLAKQINASVPRDRRIWSSIPVAEAYTRPEVLVYYYSAECELLQDMLIAAITDEMQPRRMLRFSLPHGRYSHLRLIQNRTSNEMWSISDLRFLSGTSAVAPARIDSDPFPWDLRLALDANPLTRWRSWQPMRKGMRVDAFFTEQELDGAELRYSFDQGEMDVTIDGVDAKFERLALPSPGDLRRAATRAIKARRVDYLLIGAQYPTAKGMREDPAGWGLRLVAEHDMDRIYEIQ